MSVTRSAVPAAAAEGAPEAYDWPALIGGLDRYLRLRTTPIGMKLFETVDEMAAIPRIRRPKVIHTADQIVAQACRLGWTVGITGADLVGTQCAAVLGLGAKARDLAVRRPHGRRLVRFRPSFARKSGLRDGGSRRGGPPRRDGRGSARPLSGDGGVAPGVGPARPICMIYATPAQMILFINGLQWTGYRKLDWSCVGESACADSWGRALITREPSLSIPCFAERRYGGVLEDELLMALPPKYLPKIIEGLARLSANGLRYPIPQYGIQSDAAVGLGVSYAKK